MSGSGTMPPTTTGMSTPRARTLLDDERGEGEVGAGEHRQADRVDVFVDGGGGDGVGCLEQAGVDDFVAGVAQDAGDDFDAAVVAVEADLGDQDPCRTDGLGHQIVGTSTWRPNTSPIVAISSPSVA